MISFWELGITRSGANPEDLAKMRISREIQMLGFLSERLLRLIKRKLKQVMTFRSFYSLSYFCDALGVIVSLRMAEQSLYSRVSEIFDKQ